MLRLIVSLVIALACAQALADPPVRVARLAYTRGAVSFSPAGTDDWALAGINRPLVAGDRVWTDARGRDELQLGGVAVRMDGNTLLSILTLDDRALQVQLAQGTLNIRLRPGPAAGTVEVDTPNLALTIDQPGHYRVSVDPSGNATAVRVDDGQAQAYGQNQAYAINPGQEFRFTGPDLRNVQALDPRYRDDFDRWSAERDRRADRARAVRYVSPAMIGYEDLDDYGNWRAVPDYGYVWSPRSVPRGWAPYRDGHWAWIEPWGWTWIDDAPWGFAVTHYGRWANIDNGWAWVPEPANAMPVYAPALVVFATSVLIIEQDRRRGPDVAWFPLAPHEAYRPPYQASPRYLSAINFNAGNAPPATYRNRSVNGAVTAVPVNVFTRAQPVRGAGVAVPGARIAQAQVVAAPQVQAGRESMASHLTGGHRPAQALLARPALTRMRPAVAGAGQGPATQVQGTQAPQPVPAAGQQARGRGPAIGPGPHGSGPQAMPTQIAPLPPNEARGAHMPPGAHQQQGRAAPAPGQPQNEQSAGRRGPPPGPAERQQQGAVPMQGPGHQQRPAVPTSPGAPVPPHPRDAAPNRREAVPNPRDGPAPHREAPHPQAMQAQPAPPRPEPAHPHARQQAQGQEQPHAPPQAQRPEPPRPQPAPHQEQPRQPQARPEPPRQQAAPHPGEARSAPQQQHPQQGEPARDQHGRNGHKDDQH